jgi:formate/nitrite transporter FocA (FNT family)
MSLFSMEIMAGVDAVTFGRILVNLGAVTAGNILGGMSLSLAYWSLSKKTEQSA